MPITSIPRKQHIAKTKNTDQRHRKTGLLSINPLVQCGETSLDSILNSLQIPISMRVPYNFPFPLSSRSISNKAFSGNSGFYSDPIKIN